MTVQARPAGFLAENLVNPRNAAPNLGIEGDHVMPKITEIRESIDKKLDRWEAGATAFEAQLQQTGEQALAKLEARKKTLKEALEKFKSEVAKAKGIAEEKKTGILAQCDDLHVQLALVKADARDAFAVQRKVIKYSIATLESTVERHLDAAGHAADKSIQEAADKFIAAAIEYEAEADALEARFVMKKTEAKAQFEKKKSDLMAQINEFKAQVQGKRNMTRDKAATFEQQLSAGISQIKQAFKTLSD
jgi:DNA repair exonuclease SbcCD ATPase subunit